MQGRDAIVRYLEDAEAAERNFEDSLMIFANTGEQNAVKSMFKAASRKAKTQRERLEARLRELGGNPSAAKSILAHVLAISPTLAQIGYEGVEKNTQHLIACIGAASGEMAMYESLACVAAAAGDTQTEALARELQKEEKDDWDQSWSLLRASALSAFQRVIGLRAAAGA